MTSVVGTGAAGASDTPAPSAELGSERQVAVDLFNGAWELLEIQHRTPAQDDRLLHMAHASRFHWENVGTKVNIARGEWMCSRVYAVLGRSEPALHHARRVLELCLAHGIADFDLAFAHEALARAQALAGDLEAARHEIEQALAAAPGITDDEDRVLLLADLESIPGQPRLKVETAFDR